MAEISREDAINRLKKECAIGENALSECENPIRIENITNLIDSIDKAISDMQKMDKIEDLLRFFRSVDDTEHNFRQLHNDILQIVKD